MADFCRKLSSKTRFFRNLRLAEAKMTVIHTVDGFQMPDRVDFDPDSFWILTMNYWKFIGS